MRLTFLHWSFAPSEIARFVPSPLRLDTFDGRAWVGLTPFSIRGVRPIGLPALPGLSDGAETNVRTYVRSPDGRAGVLFLSLDITMPHAVAAGRAVYRLPYMWAAAAVSERTRLHYRGRRRWGGPPASWDIAVEPGEPIADDDVSDLDDFLTSRWWLFSRYGRALAATPVEHEPWPLRRARLDHLDEDLLSAVGVRRPSGDPHVLMSPGVHTRIGLTRPITEARPASESR